MTISKLTPLFCALALGAMGLCARADDASAPSTAVTNVPTGTNVVSSVDAKAQAKADKAAAKAKAKADKAAAKAKAQKSAPAPAAGTNSVAPGEEEMHLVLPALPISASKADQLKALLAKYKTDQITPEEYHQQRAAILAQP
jgi:cell division septation protein DedD